MVCWLTLLLEEAVAWLPGSEGGGGVRGHVRQARIGLVPLSS